METLTRSSARSLEYYIYTKRWNADLEFFKDEIDFLNKLLKQHFMRLADSKRSTAVAHLIGKLGELINKKHQIKELLDHQLKCLELLAEDFLSESNDGIAGRQAQLEYSMIGLIDEYREIKRCVFDVMDKVLSDNELQIH